MAERRSCRLASVVYALYGKKGAVLPEEGAVETDVPYHRGEIGCHCRTGKHAICALDWEQFMSFWDARLIK